MRAAAIEATHEARMMVSGTEPPLRIRGHLPWDAIDRRLRAGRAVIISTTRPDGRPHAMPVWFCWLDRRVYFITARTTQKARNLAAQPWVVAHFGDGDEVLMVEGQTRRVEDTHERDRVDLAYRAKYVDPVSGATASIFDNPADDLYRLDPRRVVTWMYGTVAGWTEWRFEADTGDRPTA
jgi:nitroimidazol reductase NimA-like FMN-containing flavoprotein (pyridoxamine 5'-phosphate oxidase superfamily)